MSQKEDEKLLDAAKSGHVDNVELALKRGANVNTLDKRQPPFSYTPLHHAARNGHTAVVSKLLDWKADPNSTTKDKTTPLHSAAWWGHYAVADKLVQLGARLDAVDEVKRSPLHLAAWKGRTKICHLLIQKGMNLNGADEKGDTPLHFACRLNQTDTIEFFLTNGADPNLKNNENKTPLDLVSKDKELIMQIVKTKDSLKKESEKIFALALKEGHVLIEIIKLVLMGPPAAGKTSFLRLLFNMAPLKHHNSTAIASRPIRAIDRIVGAREGSVWEKTEGADLLKKVMEALLQTEGIIKDETKESEIKDAPSLEIGNIEIVDTIMLPNTLVEDEHQQGTDQDTTPELCSLGVNAPNKDVSSEATTVDPTKYDPSYYSDQIVGILAKQNISKEIYKSTWIHVLDSGGQPQFADVSRAFLRGNCLNVIVTKLNECLSDIPKFLYSIDGKPLHIPSADSSLQMTNLQLIKYFVRSIVSSKHTVVKKDGDKVEMKPFFCIVGTNHDNTKGISSFFKTLEPLEDKNTQLLDALQEFKDHLIFYDEENNSLIFPVNNMCSKDREKISGDIRQRMTSYKDVSVQVEIPIRWYVFELRVKEEAEREEHGMILVQTCFKIGSELGMTPTDIDHTIEHLHSLSLFLYFPEVVEKVIFTNPQYLVDLVSKLILASFVDSQKCNIFKSTSFLSVNWYRKLHEEGIFDSDLIDALDLNFVDGLFTKKDFLLLMEHLLILSPLKDDKLQQYFIPVALKGCQVEEDVKSRFTKTCQPLLLQFENGILPQGVFLATVVALLNRKQSPIFKLDVSSKNFDHQRRYGVKLTSISLDDVHGSVLLVDSLCWIEVYFTGDPNKCSVIFDIIEEAITSCAEPLCYEPSALKFTVAFLCRHADHRSIPPHPAELYPRTRKVKCTLENESELIPLDPEREAPWIKRYEEEGKCARNLYATKPEKSAILTHLTCVSAKWYEMGDLLGVDSNTLEGLSTSNFSNDVKLSKMLQKWLDNEQTPVTWENILKILDGPLKKKSVADAIRKSLDTL